MTTQTAIIITADYGSSLSTPTLRNYLTDTLIIAADSANEVTADSGRYALVFDETSVHSAGWYGLRAFVSGAPINRFVYFTGVDGETAIAVDNLPVGLPQTGQVIVTRPVGDDTPITFSFPVASATLTGTRRINNAGSTTSLSGARSFLRTSGTQHLYSLAYNAADRPSDDGVVEYVFTDGTYSRSVLLKAVTAVLDSAVLAQLGDIETDTAASVSYLSSLTSAIAAIAAIFTGMTSLPNWLRRAWRKDAGTAGMTTAQTEINTGGTATFAGTTDSQEAIKDALGSSGGGPAYSAAVVAARLPVGSAAGWPQEILCGSAYLTALGTHVPVYVKDVDDNILAEMGDKTFTDGDFKAILRLSPLTDANKLLAQPAATIEVDSYDSPGIVFNDDVDGEEYFELQMPKAKTALGEIRTRYLCQLILRWGDGSTYEWYVNLGESKFIRGVAAAP